MKTIEHARLAQVIGGCSDHPPNVECKGTVNFCGNKLSFGWPKSEPSAPAGPPKAPAGGTPAPMPHGNP